MAQEVCGAWELEESVGGCIIPSVCEWRLLDSAGQVPGGLRLPKITSKSLCGQMLECDRTPLVLRYTPNGGVLAPAICGLILPVSDLLPANAKVVR